MIRLPRERWTERCTALARALEYERPRLHELSVRALASTPGSRAFAPYSSRDHAPCFTVGQLVAASYVVWKRAYFRPGDHDDFIRFLWAHVLQEQFAVASAFLDRLALRSSTRLEQLLGLFAALAPRLVSPVLPGDTLLLAANVGIPLVESSFRATAETFGDSAAPAVTFHRWRPSPRVPLFDEGLVDLFRPRAASTTGDPSWSRSATRK